MSLFQEITDRITKAVKSAYASRAATQPEREMPMPFLTGQDRKAEDERIAKEWDLRREMEDRQRRERNQEIDPYAVMHGKQLISALGVEAIQRKHEAEREEFEKRVSGMRKGGLP